MRNRLTHHERLNDVDLERLFLTRIMAESDDSAAKAFEAEHRREYRKFARSWGLRAKQRGEMAEALIDSLATALLERADFLQN